MEAMGEEAVVDAWEELKVRLLGISEDGNLIFDREDGKMLEDDAGIKLPEGEAGKKVKAALWRRENIIVKMQCLVDGTNEVEWEWVS